MNNKQLLLATLILALAGIVGFRLSAQQEPSGPGNARYVLVQGEYLFIPTTKGTANLTERGVFRIDTASGKTWRFVFRGSETYWDPITEMRVKSN